MHINLHHRDEIPGQQELTHLLGALAQEFTGHTQALAQFDDLMVANAVG